MGLGDLFIVGTSAVLVAVGPEQPRPPLYLCRVYLLIGSTAVVVRLWSLSLRNWSPVQTRMNNTTLPQESDTALDSPGFMAYSILLTVIVLVAGVVMGVTAIRLGRARSIPRPLRLFLINLLLAGLLMALEAVFLGVTSAVLVAVDPEQPRPPLYLCRVNLWMYGMGSATRLLNLAAFSLSVVAIVRFGKKTISLLHAAVIITILWLVPIITSLFIMLPYVYEAQFVQGVACFPDDNNTVLIQARHTLTAIWFTFGGLTPMAVNIAVPIICLCYIKKNTVTEDIQYQKGLSKFSLFLMLGGASNMVGQLIPGLVAYYKAAPGLYIAYGFASISLLPTPIIIIAYLKPVQEQLKKMFTCGVSTAGAKDSSWTTSTPGSNETEEKL